MKKQLHSHPRKFGKDSRGCRVTASCQGLIRKYGINMSRRTFREQAELIGFTKFRWAIKLVLKGPMQCNWLVSIHNDVANINMPKYLLQSFCMLLTFQSKLNLNSKSH